MAMNPPAMEFFSWKNHRDGHFSASRETDYRIFLL
jgi:hypothetical protein